MFGNKCLANVFLISGLLALAIVVTYRVVIYSERTIASKQIENDDSCDNTYQSELVFNVNGVSFVMKCVEGGTFLMGSSNYEADEQPVHNVKVNSFYICEIEVTQALWKEVMGKTVIQQRDLANQSGPLRGVGANCPMYYVNWYECQDFICRLNLKTGKQFRLPTEAEWEYAAKGGNHSGGFKFAGSNSIDGVAWYTDNSNISVHPVKSKAPNELGLFDMSGNVWEWCSDCYNSDYYLYSSSNNPINSSGEKRVVRGGSWYSKPSFCRISKRHKLSPDYRDTCYGFRLAMDI